jgi:hypothetical protein
MGWTLLVARVAEQTFRNGISYSPSLGIWRRPVVICVGEERVEELRLEMPLFLKKFTFRGSIKFHHMSPLILGPGFKACRDRG